MASFVANSFLLVSLIIWWLLEGTMIWNPLLVLLLVAALVVGVSVVPQSYSDYPPPLQQIRDDGVSLEDVQCNEGLVHAIRANGAHVCVRETTAERLDWKVFVSEVATGGTAPNASSPAGFVDDGRGVGVTAPPKPPAPVQTPVEDDPFADGSPEVPLRDPRFYVADNKITLQGVENKLPNLTGVWMPITKEEAEQVVMPRLAAALGDRLILPEIADYELCMRIPLSDCPRFLDESDPDSLSYYPYDTERGNTFSAWKKPGNSGLVSSIKYRIYDWMPYEEREEFFISFMEKAGFSGADVRIGDVNGVIYGGMVPVYLEFLADHRGAFMQLNFRGWTNEYVDDRLPEGLLLPREEVKTRAHAFAAAHTDLWDKEKCALSLKDVEAVGIISRTVIAGVPLDRVVVGNCHHPDNPGYGPRSQSVTVEATEGEIIFPRYLYYLVEDWAERIDIPESARVDHNNNDNDR